MRASRPAPIRQDKIMTSSFPRLQAGRMDAVAVDDPDGKALTLAVPEQADRVRKRPEEAASWTAGGGLRCLWYGPGLADTLTTVDEFLRTPAVTAALAEFYQARRGSRAAERDVHALIDAVGVTAAKLRG
jgi:hypothetical protein